MRKESWTQTTSDLCFQKTKPRHHHFKIWLSNIILRSKSCTFVKFFFNFWLFVKNVSRIWRVVKVLVQNLTKCEKKWKICCLKKRRNCKKCHFYVVKLIEKWLFEQKFSFKTWHALFFFISLSDTLHNVGLKIRLVVKSTAEKHAFCKIRKNALHVVFME